MSPSRNSESKQVKGLLCPFRKEKNHNPQEQIGTWHSDNPFSSEKTHREIFQRALPFCVKNENENEQSKKNEERHCVSNHISSLEDTTIMSSSPPSPTSPTTASSSSSTPTTTTTTTTTTTVTENRKAIGLTSDGQEFMVPETYDCLETLGTPKKWKEIPVMIQWGFIFLYSYLLMFTNTPKWVS